VDTGDVLESGIDIVARPPGKQLQGISLLSGGEQTMTAVSLLFAIYQVKPSPFCVLDELDAPLDESNNNRFTKVLQRFLEHSQFIVITHSKRTISIADVLYGVTMQERGVSKIVSVKFHRADEIDTDVQVHELVEKAASATVDNPAEATSDQEETVRGFEDLLGAGKIRSWGVSNLDLSEMNQLVGIKGGQACAANQVLYNLARRGIEFDLLPWCRGRGMPVMAYTPIEQGRILGNPALLEVAQRLGATPAQVALAWVLRQDGVVTIPKASTIAHVRENRNALELKLDAEALAALDTAFPPPRKARPLEML
jgi:hypothetical protein